MSQRVSFPIQIPRQMYNEFMAHAESAASNYGVLLSHTARKGLLAVHASFTIEGDETSINLFVQWLQKIVAANQ